MNYSFANFLYGLIVLTLIGMLQTATYGIYLSVQNIIKKITGQFSADFAIWYIIFAITTTASILAYLIGLSYTG